MILNIAPSFTVDYAAPFLRFIAEVYRIIGVTTEYLDGSKYAGLEASVSGSPSDYFRSILRAPQAYLFCARVERAEFSPYRNSPFEPLEFKIEE